jgi:drug/metabolite transporter (DMT)-like permease
VALLNNFEIVATTLVARIVFRDAVGKRMWLAILLITLASVLLTVEDISSLSFSAGSVFVVLACLCWGIENNCTRMLSIRVPMQIELIREKVPAWRPLELPTSPAPSGWGALYNGLSPPARLLFPMA